MITVPKKMFMETVATLVYDHDTHFPDKQYFQMVYVHGSDDRWTVKQFEPQQALALLHCKATGVEKWFRWEAISYIEPF